MSSSYSANQYDSAFRSQRLQNWCETKRFKEKPTAKRGHTTFIANDRGHLLPGVVQSGSAWPDFKGTWDLPARIPVHHINPTGRSAEGLKRLKSWGVDPQCTGKSQARSCSKNSERLQDVGKQTSADILQDCCAPSAAEARPASQSCPITGGERTASQNQDLRVAPSAEDNQATQATGADGPSGQCSVAEEKPPLSQAPAAGGTSSSGPDTGNRRPVSSVSEKATPSSSRQRVRDTQKDH